MRYEEELNTENLFYNTNEYDFNLIKTQDVVSTSDIKNIILDGIDTYDHIPEYELYLIYDAYSDEYTLLNDAELYNPYSDIETDYMLITKLNNVKTNGQLDDEKIKTFMKYGNELFNLLHHESFSLYELTNKMLDENFKTHDDYNTKAKEYGILVYNPIDNTILFGDQTSKNINNVVRTFDISTAKDAIKDEFIKRNAKYVVTKENKKDGSISFELSGEPKKDDNIYKILNNTKTDNVLSELEHICSYGMDIDHRISTLDDRKNIQNKLNDSLNELKIFRDYNRDFER